MQSKGYVAICSEPLTKTAIGECLKSWLDRFEKVEQVAPKMGASTSTISVSSEKEIMWEKNMQFRVLSGPDFAWVYLSLDGLVIETSGLPQDEIALCLDVLLELPNVTEIIDENNDKRLDELESEGLL
jgi:hypothetical protein